MSHVAWSVCLCVGHTDVLFKTAEPIDMPFGGLTLVGPIPCIRLGQNRTNPFAASRDDKSAMRPFAKLL